MNLLRAVPQCLCLALLAQAAQASATESAAEGVVESTNAFRAAHGRATLEEDASLARTALDFARFMAMNGKYGHGADGRTPVERAHAHGYEHCILAENIAYQYRSSGFTAQALAQAFVEGWKESPGHRRNMLDPAVTQTGVGIAQDDQGRYFAVQLFGLPKDGAIRFSVENAGRESLRYSVGGRGYRLDPRVTRTHMQCRPSTLALPGRSIKPEDGARYVVN